MKRTPRRTFLGLVGASSVLGLGAYELTGGSRPTDEDIPPHVVDGMVTVADAVYPGDPEQFRPVVRSYTTRLGDSRRGELLGTLSELDRISSRHAGSPFRTLAGPEATRLLERLGVNRVQSRRQGTLSERVRFHLVNSVLYAILTDPAGTGRFDIDNPAGYPGGFDSYTQSGGES
jgi:hypothetical protein